MPNILFLDIEVSLAEGKFWEHRMYEMNIQKITKPSFFLCFAYKWEGKETKVVLVSDFPHYYRNKRNDQPLVKELRELLDKADVVIGHNSKKFDIKKFNTRCMDWGIPPPTPFKQVDTLEQVKKFFSLPSNKLDYVAERWGHGGKAESGDIDFWIKCEEGNLGALKKLGEYCKHDVELDAEIFKDLEPYFKQKNPIWGKEKCPKCGGENTAKWGSKVGGGKLYQRILCKDCSHYFKGAQIISKI